MAVSRTTYTSLLGYDPVEEERNRQKLWATLYAGASSPWEKVGIGIGQLAGGLFGGQSTAASQQEQLNKVASEASQRFAPNSAEYFEYIAENLPDSMTMVKANAASLARDAATKERTAMQADTKYIKENPEALAIELQPLTTRLENKAKVLYAKEGYDPASGEPVPESIMKKLEATPEYKKIAQLSQVGQTALIDKAQKEEKEALTLENLQVSIKKNKAELAKIGTDLDAGTRWNMERQAAIDFFKANNLDPTKPLDQATALMNPALVSQQKIALREVWRGGKQQPSEAAKPSDQAKPRTIDPADREALNWLMLNPKHPDAEKVRKKLKDKEIL